VRLPYSAARARSSGASPTSALDQSSSATGRFEPRNLAFTHGLHRWQLDGTFLRQAGSHDQDYSCTTEDGRVILAAAVPGPAGFAFLSQEIEPDDYRGRAVTFAATCVPPTSPTAPDWRSASPPRTAAGPTGSLARSREPLRPRHRNPRLDPPRGQRPGPG
jgi:hypothetical protein